MTMADARAAIPAGRSLSLPSVRLPVPVAIYIFSVVLPITFQFGSLTMTTLRLLLLILIVPMAFQLYTGRFGRIQLPDILFPAYVLWTMVSLARNNPDAMIEQTGSVGVEFLGGYLLGRAYIRSAAQFLALARLMSVVVLIFIPFAIYETTTTRPILLEMVNRLPGLKDVFLLPAEFRMGLDRVQLTFAHPIHFGIFCSVSFVLTMVALERVRGLFYRLFFAAVAAGCVFLSLSSGALLAVLMQAFLIGWQIVFRRSERRWWLLVALTVAAYVAVDLASNRTPIRVFMSYATFSAHNAYWRAAIFDYGIQNVWANPVFGLGMRRWVKPYWMFTSSVDNFWLLTAMRFGIPGFLLLAIGYLAGLYRVIGRNFAADPMLASLRLAWVFCFLSMTFSLATVHIWTNIFSFVFFMFGAGMWLITAEPEGTPDGVPAAQEDPAGRRRSAFTRFAGAPPAPVAREARAASAEAAPQREQPRYSRDLGAGSGGAGSAADRPAAAAPGRPAAAPQRNRLPTARRFPGGPRSR